MSSTRRRLRFGGALWLACVVATAVHGAARSPSYGARGMVVASEASAARAGLAMFARGGNAVDAAIATAFALGVTQPFSAGVGGGAFALIRRPDGTIVALDARETAPAAATRDMYVEKGVPERASVHGPLAIATPGFVAGCALALERWGTKPLAEVLAPAIALAEEGVPIGLYHATMLERLRRRGLGKGFEETVRIQFPPKGVEAKPGWRLVQPDLAATLRRIAAEGPDAFYRGEIARALVQEVQKRGGLLTLEDLDGYEPRVRKPVSGEYRGYAVHSFPPPSSGGVALIEALNILEGFDLGELGAGSSTSVHRIAEAMKLAFADRAAWLGDPDFVDVPTGELVSKRYAEQLRTRIGERAASVAGPGLLPDDAGTTHLSTSDAKGGAVALTMTINTPFGSGISVPGTGVVMNNEMDDFSVALDTPNAYGLVDTRGANAIAPGKRPLSSMTPTIVERGGRLFMVTGSPGGPRIISTTLLTVLHVIDYGMDVSEAVSAPRFHHQWQPDRLAVEDEVPRDVVEALRARGHEVSVESDWSAAEAIVLDPDGAHWGGTDPRRDGAALGY